VRAGLLQVYALARTIERHFTLLTATLRTNTSVNREAEPLFFSSLADGTTHK
jgi:hypothetical protein